VRKQFCYRYLLIAEAVAVNAPGFGEWRGAERVQCALRCAEQQCFVLDVAAVGFGVGLWEHSVLQGCMKYQPSPTAAHATRALKVNTEGMLSKQPLRTDVLLLRYVGAVGCYGRHHFVRFSASC
jgi:hypothetical protein